MAAAAAAATAFVNSYSADSTSVVAYLSPCIDRPIAFSVARLYELLAYLFCPSKTYSAIICGQ